MKARTVYPSKLAVLLVVVSAWRLVAAAEQVPVRHAEGLVHGFLVLRATEGDKEILAEGELIQTSQRDVVTSELVFHFKDGSLHDEVATFSERGKFRLIHDHLVQKGPSFKRPMEMDIDARTGEVKIHYAEDGKEKDISEKIKAPLDLANGMTFTLLKNVDPKLITEFSMIAATPKPRLVKLKVTPQPEETFKIPDGERKAAHYVIHIDIGGVAGWLAPVLGKEPPDIHIWVLQGKAPAFLKAVTPLYANGPIWQIELSSPQYPKEK